MRVFGDLETAAEEAVSEEELTQFLETYLPGINARLQQECDIDTGLSLEEGERFRLNLYFQQGRMAMAARRVPSGALDFEELQIPDFVSAFCEKPRGLVLITGATGSGKSTTLAAMLHYMNKHLKKHIITIEDPIEFVHTDRSCFVSQREIGTDTQSFATALKHVVRQNPDVIFIGEMRDLDTINTAISAAMTGQLVISTMHTVDVCQTVERIINYFPENLRPQVALDFSLALNAIISQRLLRRKDQQGVVPAFESLLATPRVQHVIAGRHFDHLPEILRGSSEEGMQTFSHALVQLCREDLVSTDAAAAAATNREEFYLALEGMETGIDTLRDFQGERAGQTVTDMKTLLHTAVSHGASDLHLSVRRPPVLRINGELREMDLQPLTPAETKRLLFSVLTPQQRARFETDREIDFALSISEPDADSQSEKSGSPARDGGNSAPEQYRFRVSGFYEKGAVAGAFRLIPQYIPTPEELMLPEVLCRMALQPQGLILITGSTGHGKSTTLACLIEQINQHRACHVITIEDPIEFVHTDQQAVIQQREVGADTHSFNDALKYVLREDADVILVGEMRDRETISTALTAAQTGHLVMATLHTNSATQSVDRIIDVFPPYQQNQIRMQLAASLQAIVAQRLLPKAEGSGRLAAFEVLVGTPAVAALIRDGKTHQIQSTMETAAKEGMVTMEKAIQILYQKGYISHNTLSLHTRELKVPSMYDS